MAESNEKFKCHCYNNLLQSKPPETAWVPRMVGRNPTKYSVPSESDVLDKHSSSAVKAENAPSLWRRHRIGRGRRQAGRQKHNTILNITGGRKKNVKRKRNGVTEYDFAGLAGKPWRKRHLTESLQNPNEEHHAVGVKSTPASAWGDW